MLNKKKRKAFLELKDKYPALKFIIEPAVFIWKVNKFIFNSRYRSENLTHWLYRNKISQKSTFTKPDRYPFLFQKAKEYFEGKPIHILSYGCSTGEEVFSLNRYFPDAHITGIDINPHAIAIAKKKNNSGTNNFHLPSYLESLPNEYFDLIFALGVLQSTKNRKKGITKSHPSYPFRKFEEQVNMLDRLLKRNGLLVIDNTDYPFSETVLSEKYSPVPDSIFERNRPVFDKNNRLISKKSKLVRMFKKI